MKGYKVIREDMNHHGFKYKKGLNIDTKKFNKTGSCVEGGFYFFTDLNDLPEWLGYGDYLWEVTVPEGALCVQDPDGNKYRASQLILGKRHKLSSKNIWKQIINTCNKEKALRLASRNGHTEVVRLLLSAGADVHADNDYALRYASENGHVEVVRLLLTAGADVHADNDYALRIASMNGHVGVVKLLLEAGADVHAKDDDALRWASENGHVEVVRMLLEAGADIHALDDYALRWASANGHIEVVSLLKEWSEKYK